MKSSPGFEDNSMAWQGLTWAEIEAALERPDQVQRLEFPKLSASVERPLITIYIKIRPDLEPPAYLVALATKGHKDPGPELMDAWRVPMSWVRKDPVPLQVLMALAERCGAKLECGGAEGRILLEKHLPFVSEPPGLMPKNVPGGVTLYGRTICTVRADAPVFEVAIAYLMRDDLVKREIGPQVWRPAGS